MRRALVTAIICMTAAPVMALPMKLKTGGTVAVTTTTPEIQAAEVRVNQAKAQLDVANKQLGAARALLKAAQADLRASEAELRALSLHHHAQGLATETGMTPAKAAPVQLAEKALPKEEPAATAPAAPPVAPAPGADTRIRAEEVNAGSNDQPPTIELR